ncbi:carbohydrate-binding family 9-like protein [uncultured Alistipes sp.]|uniref:carbohydrate-binding family 9-like protein n=1 Tax=uncultured Alistipes sp. TaxID=538949 RepID=UPI002805E86F|nr:carbohydrate-binding family 9-like protein [uncultured Alistipes sp.]
MKIRKINGVNPADRAAVDEAFARIESHPIACCNWPAGYPYAPEVRFRMFHTGDRLIIRFDVAENYTAARVTADNGEVWTDSCVEFFLAVGDETGYYNFETTCIGRMLLGFRHTHADAVHASQEMIDDVIRQTTYPFGEPFEEIEGNNRWSVTLAIPPRALFRHRIEDWSGVKARVNLYKCGDRLSHPHFLSWRPIISEKPDFHRPEFFEPVDFEC